jgi:3-oxoacid CoA-transferase subunit A
MFLPTIDQTSVDQSTEIWLDKIEESIEYKAWLCGHWHTDKRVDKVHFLFNGFESEEWLHDENNSK